MTEQDDFYLGYLPRAPRGVKRRVRRFCLLLLGGAALLALMLVAGQRRFAAGTFEFQQDHQFEGIVRALPYPTLLVLRPGETGGQPAYSSYLLVGVGKHGAQPEVASFDGRHVRLQGSLIYRDGMTMIEVVPHSLRDAPVSAVAPRQVEELGEFKLVGEIVDGKCYLGVMNPGATQPHRDCAVRCISGGAPPLFVARDAAGQTASFLLVSASGQPVNHEVLDFVAEPVEITGRVQREGEQLFLRADPNSFRRR